jgi:hypothetical protein
MLRLITDLQGLERGNGHRGYRVYIGIRFASNKKFRFHVRWVLVLSGQRHHRTALG